MDENRYSIKGGLLRRLVEHTKVLSMMYHACARLVTIFGAKRFRSLADAADADAEEVKREMRRQDGRE